MENIAYLLLGSNLGDREKIISQTKEKLKAQINIFQESEIYETDAWGLTDQPDFLNQVLAVKTDFLPEDLLVFLHEIENEMGRERVIKYGARTIDIDILYYNSETIDTQKLTVPHPHIQDRRFALVPLAEIAPNFMHPKYEKTNRELLAICTDYSSVHVFNDYNL